MTCIEDPRDARALLLLREIVVCLIDEPQQVEIDVQVRDRKVYFGVSANPGDVAFLIGQLGDVADAIQTLMKAIAKRGGRRYVVYFQPTASSGSVGAFREYSRF